MIFGFVSKNYGLLTKLWRPRVELLWQEAVISETLHRVSHRDDRHHHQPAPQDVQKATHRCSEKSACPAREEQPHK